MPLVQLPLSIRRRRLPTTIFYYPNPSTKTSVLSYRDALLGKKPNKNLILQEIHDLINLPPNEKKPTLIVENGTVSLSYGSCSV